MTDNNETNDAEAALEHLHRKYGKDEKTPAEKPPKRPTMSRTRTRKMQRRSPEIARNRDTRRPETVPSNVSSITIRGSQRALS